MIVRRVYVRDLCSGLLLGSVASFQEIEQDIIRGDRWIFADQIKNKNTHQNRTESNSAVNNERTASASDFRWAVLDLHSAQLIDTEEKFRSEKITEVCLLAYESNGSIKVTRIKNSSQQVHQNDTKSLTEKEKKERQTSTKLLLVDQQANRHVQEYKQKVKRVEEDLIKKQNGSHVSLSGDLQARIGDNKQQMLQSYTKLLKLEHQGQARLEHAKSLLLQINALWRSCATQREIFKQLHDRVSEQAVKVIQDQRDKIEQKAIEFSKKTEQALAELLQVKVKNEQDGSLADLVTPDQKQRLTQVIQSTKLSRKRKIENLRLEIEKSTLDMNQQHEKVITRCNQLQKKCANFEELDYLVSVKLTQKINDTKQHCQTIINLFEKGTLEWSDYEQIKKKQKKYIDHLKDSQVSLSSNEAADQISQSILDEGTDVQKYSVKSLSDEVKKELEKQLSQLQQVSNELASAISESYSKIRLHVSKLESLIKNFQVDQDSERLQNALDKNNYFQSDQKIREEIARRKMFDNGLAKVLCAVHETAQEEYKKRADFLLEASSQMSSLFIDHYLKTLKTQVTPLYGATIPNQPNQRSPTLTKTLKAFVNENVPLKVEDNQRGRVQSLLKEVQKQMISCKNIVLDLVKVTSISASSTLQSHEAILTEEVKKKIAELEEVSNLEDFCKKGSKLIKRNFAEVLKQALDCDAKSLQLSKLSISQQERKLSTMTLKEQQSQALLNLNSNKNQQRPNFGDKLMFIDQERDSGDRVYKPVGFPDCQLDMRNEENLPEKNNNVRPKCLIGVVQRISELVKNQESGNVNEPQKILLQIQLISIIK